MAEYLSPGVYIEEVSYRSTKAIAGVGTTTTGFVGPTRYGPTALENQLVTSLDEFERTYGDGQPLTFDDGTTVPNFVWHAARAFFTEGGTKLYVSRVVSSPLRGAPRRASWQLVAGSPSTSPSVWARYPGAYGNMRVQLTVRVSQNVLRFLNGVPSVGSLGARDVVMIRSASASAPGASPVSTAPAPFPVYVADWDATAQSWVFTPEPSSPGGAIHLANVTAAQGLEIRVLTLAVTVYPQDPNHTPQTWSNLALDPGHQTNGVYDSFVGVFGPDPNTPGSDPATTEQEYGRDLPIAFDQAGLDGLQLLQFLFQANPSLPLHVYDVRSSDAARSVSRMLSGGTDGLRPGLEEYTGSADPDHNVKTGLVQFEDIEDISIVAAPGSTYLFETGYRDIGLAIMQEVVAHCEKMRYRIGVLDSGNGETLNQVRALRGQFDSSYAALYYPWIRVLDPITSNPIYLPPSGFVCGIYARNDVTRAVYKAPANEVVTLAQGFELNINKAQQDVLNPEGINCFRYFEGRGYRLWGARTASSDTEWNYVNLRRYFAYVERSIDIGTQWAVFEPNGDKLWGSVRRSIEEFLLNEWQAGALLGTKPEEAFFVRCDRTTMTQSDIDNGRLVCQVGLAALRPAEFVIFRIGQWTGDRTS